MLRLQSHHLKHYEFSSYLQKLTLFRAIGLTINGLNQQILDNDPSLLFHLQQQRLVELIRKGQIAEALIFAQQELAPRGEENPAFLAELESTMVLLAFDLPSTLPPTASTNSKSRDKSSTSINAQSIENENLWSSSSLPTSMKSLLHPEQRRRTALEVNAAILSSQSYSPSAKLPNLIRMLAWGEQMLEEKNDFPKLDLKGLLTPPLNEISALPSTGLGSVEIPNGTTGTELPPLDLPMIGLDGSTMLN